MLIKTPNEWKDDRKIGKYETDFRETKLFKSQLFLPTTIKYNAHIINHTCLFKKGPCDCHEIRTQGTSQVSSKDI